MVRKAEIPFDPERRRNTTIVERDGSRMLSVKGAPEDILNLCRVTGAESESVLKEFHAMGTEGMRVLALAQREVGVKDTYGPSDEEGAQFIGLVGFIDPLKPTAKDAITLAERLNVRVKIVTGDSLEVAAAVGIKVGVIDTVADAISGTSLAALTDAEFADAVERYDVFARITPELKFKIVSVLEKKHATGFLGEGINDAPALKEANVAMVVAGAADVAREAADVVLLDRSLSVVIDAIKEGRTMYANVLKYIKYTLVGNFGNFYSIAIISLFIKFLPLTPEQILLINLLTDFPLIAVATDTVDLEELATPRRFNIKKIALYTTVLGLVSTVFDLIFFGIFRHSEPGMLQTLWFYESVLSEVVLIFALRTNRFVLRARPPAYLLTSLAVVTVIITIALPFTSFGQSVFHFVSPGSGALVAIFLIVAAYFMTTEAAKLAYQRLWGKASLASGRS
jgi:Mg2+-importing ATPase